MISRYEHPEISSIWGDKSKFGFFLDVELALLEAMEGDFVPTGTSKHIREKAQIKTDRIEEIEQTTKHDVIAFCSSITEQVDDEFKKYFHFGVTSSDIIDTALTLQIKSSMTLISNELKGLLQALNDKANEYKDLLCLGRSHGMYAEPMSFGQKFLLAYAEFDRRLADYNHFFETELTGQLSGAVGNYAVITPKIETAAMKILSLRVEPVSTQVIPRDRIAKLMNIHALMGAAIERLCTEIRLLHHSDIGELHEGFSKGQKGSSTMPHKKNPISTENLTGIARLLRSHAMVAMENTNLWHERDISHSSAERFILPDSFGCLYYALKRLNNTVQNLVVHSEHIEQKVRGNFTYLSSYVLHELIKINEKTREELYEVVQTAAFNAKEQDEFFTIIKNLCRDKKLTAPDFSNLGVDAVKTIFLQNSKEVFKRTLN
jgi:adenylosuccinate lyase